ncbi:peptidase M15 [Enterococcus saigonensis]|uniref:Peptidase M15 n=1 Tax=Enterococcus saigonensis TaxID=1805431 RepID=A0A679IL67_9ENTE|nr:M15 family metallopeptidase [Enterococcus saigonensis]BCA86006.1 peptidase M15 [Enterococcus saigonensis]
MNKIIGAGAVLVVAAATFFVFFNHYQQNDTNPTVEPTATAVSTKEETTTSSVTRPKELPEIKSDDWKLVLVSPDHKIATEVSENQLTTLPDGHIVDKRIVKSYEELTAAAKAAKINLHLVSAFRSVSYQEQVFNERVSLLESQDQLTKEAATEKAKLTMTEPGYSEHHTGLAVDVVDENWLASNPNMVLDESYSKQPGAQWLQKNARRFGFIVRYPEGKEAITKITYEPWHLRYVGVESAEYISKHNLTLEEYLDQLEKWEGYEH